MLCCDGNRGRDRRCGPGRLYGAGRVCQPILERPSAALLDEGGTYFPTDPIVSGVTLQANSYNVPHVASLIVNYKHDRFAITPTLQFSGASATASRVRRRRRSGRRLSAPGNRNGGRSALPLRLARRRRLRRDDVSRRLECDSRSVYRKVR